MRTPSDRQKAKMRKDIANRVLGCSIEQVRITGFPYRSAHLSNEEGISAEEFRDICKILGGKLLAITVDTDNDVAELVVTVL